ncbi:MAG: DUF4407 domain-containing protein [Verrucomicrobiales bacterium]
MANQYPPAPEFNLSSDARSDGEPSGSRAKRFFFWLSGAGTAELEQCPEWEQRKYVAFGATVLVPTGFAFIASAYALSTITSDWRVIFFVAVAWALIILTVDRALLATYRSFQGIHRKFGQFLLRFVVAILMGLTISHPLTLLLFKDTIHSEIEAGREVEIAEVRAETEREKVVVEDKIVALEEDVAARREDWKASLKSDFLLEGEAGAAAAGAGNDLDAAAQAELEGQISEATAPNSERVASIDTEIAELKPEFMRIQGEQDFWQREFEREVDGQRSGFVGVGPRAKSIRDDQLAPRRAESKRLGDQLEHLTDERNQLRALIASTEEAVTAEFLAAQVALAEEAKEKEAFREQLDRDIKTAQSKKFVAQQDAIAGSIMDQINARNTELVRLQSEVAKLDSDKDAHIASIQAEPRRDILTQTLALHGLFEAGSEGGQFALIAYVILAALFMLVDTIPIVVKFFSKPGPYDTLVDCEEVRYAKERKAYLKSYDSYMNELSSSRLLTATKNRPLERALVDGVDRSRVAKEFIESMMELERAFEENMEAKRAQLAARGADAEGVAGQSAMLEEMAQRFYADMRQRMESFFASNGGATAGA